MTVPMVFVSKLKPFNVTVESVLANDVLVPFASDAVTTPS